MSTAPSTSRPAAGRPRVASIDATRGLVMAAMIFVNDIAGVSEAIVPRWMRHFPPDGNGMTFVDLVFPAFLFVAGMSVPVALGPRLARESVGAVLLHVVGRTLSLLLLGVLMVNESPDAAAMGWSPAVWSALLYVSAILTFGAFTGAGGRPTVTTVVRLLGFAGLVALAFAFRGKDGERIVTLSPFSVRTEWWGILGLIGWAYLVASMVYLLFRGQPTATLGCTALLYCLYPADQTGTFDGLWLTRYVGIGSTLGTHAAIATAGLLLASVVAAPIGQRIRFTVLFGIGCSAAAWLLHGLYGINKNSATPSWCLWASAITAGVWLLFDLLAATRPLSLLAKPFEVAGRNVLLAYLLHNLLYPVLDLLRLDDWYGGLARPDLAHAIGRAAGSAVVILAVTAWINRAGFRLKVWTRDRR